MSEASRIFGCSVREFACQDNATVRFQNNFHTHSFALSRTVGVRKKGALAKAITIAKNVARMNTLSLLIMGSASRQTLTHF